MYSVMIITGLPRVQKEKHNSLMNTDVNGIKMGCTLFYSQDTCPAQSNLI